MQINWKEAEAAFYGFMRHGWVSSEIIFHQKILALDGHRVFAPASDGTYKLVDMWTRTPSSDYSAGSTTLYTWSGFEWVPIWQMHYGGWYTQHGSDTVKAALRDVFAKPTDFGFRGCRGPQHKVFPEYGAVYTNLLEDGGSFQKFRGVEQVTSARHPVEPFGEHEYFGMALV